ncbi:hypothetical protein [Schlesneria paludicola]|uniref:hypothetical protein n=1 Tax=Schlesneria paludicola TaxID=360056 RepID=UPI00029A38BD|nr:hypothetical protein [Schlesneria paludicola]
MIPHICRLITAAVKNAGHALEVLEYLAPFFDLETIEKAGDFLHKRWLQMRAEQGLDKSETIAPGEATQAVEQTGEPAGEATSDVESVSQSAPTIEPEPVPEMTDTKSVSTTDEQTVEVTSAVSEQAESSVDVVTDEQMIEETAELVTEEPSVEPVAEQPKPVRKWTPKKAA